ncbi:hypothetical protein AtDm6_0938 [Acetobacter tropicalis]|uniref:Uncharacterized protein n=1 Tax=Acetobacter tropicalis TaxID=104102 RepID=A0A094YV42_9PROT|nr:hypothetical protein AtDm6_0938 [Acetobacter tropicalis]
MYTQRWSILPSGSPCLAAHRPSQPSRGGFLRTLSVQVFEGTVCPSPFSDRCVIFFLSKPERMG